MIKLFIFLIVLAAVLLLAFNTELFHSIQTGDIEAITALSGNNIAIMMLIMFVLMFIHNLLPVIPQILVITLNNTIFGFYVGFTWSFITSILSAIIVFWLSRKGFQDWVLKRVNSTYISKIQKNGLWYVIQARIFPFAPTSVINFVSAISNIRCSAFVSATVIGNFIIYFVYTLIQAGLLSAGINEYVIAGILIVVSIFYYFIMKIFVRKKEVKRQLEL